MKTIEKYINRDWQFDYGQHTDIENTSLFDDFYSIGLPHSFTTPYKGGAEFYVGYGVYAKHLVFDKEYIGKRICLEFGAVFQVAEVFLNGAHVATHEGGYTAFLVDISAIAHEGDNILVIRVNNHWSPIIAPRAGEHTFAGGIYRDVKLIVSDTSHIDWYGIGVRTTAINQDSAKIDVRVEVTNAEGQLLQVKILSTDDKVVAKGEAIVVQNKVEVAFEIKNPQLWSCETPYLYKAVCQLGDDVSDTTFGIRSVKWTRDKGFFLNEKHVLIQGANVHQDHGGWGDAVTHGGIRRDVAMMKECGMNFIRGSHYPHHTAFADECDKQGLMFWSEGVFWGIGGFCDDGYWDSSSMPTNKEHFDGFEKSLKNTMAEMIKTNRNHPSIVAWSIGNEIFFSKKDVMNDAKALASRLVDYCKEIDPTRAVAIGGVQREGFDQIGDIAGYNGDGATLFRNPKLPSIVAEYGSVASYRPGKFSLNLTKGADDFFDWRAGRAIWCGFHHGSIANIGNLGIVDLYRLPLKAWYAYREKYRGIAPPTFAKEGAPTKLKITADKMTMTNNGTDDVMLVVQALDKNEEKISCDIEVVLEVISGGGILPTGRKMKFCKEDKSFFDGACAVELRSFFAGKTKVIASCDGLASAEIEINVEGEEKYDGRTIIMPQEPSCTARTRLKGADIVANRPIFVSSEKENGMSFCLSDCDKSTFWQPHESEKVSTIEIDLENQYTDYTMSIQLLKGVKSRIEIAVSNDRKQWTKVATFDTKSFKKQYLSVINVGEYRFAQIVLTPRKNPIAIRSIKAWQN